MILNQFEDYWWNEHQNIDNEYSLAEVHMPGYMHAMAKDVCAFEVSEILNLIWSISRVYYGFHIAGCSLAIVLRYIQCFKNLDYSNI